MVSVRQRNALFNRPFEHAILDPGISIFKNVPEYPSGFLQRWLSIAKWTVERTNGKVWVTIPDYPDDENPGLTGDNVGKTLNNIKWFMEKDPNLPWLVVLQARYLNPFSFFESCERTKDLLGDYGDYPRIGIGTVCKTRKLEFIEYCCRVARTVFPRAWIHAFGLTLRALPRVKNHIDSFDSSAFTFPVTPLREGYDGIWGQARTDSEKTVYFKRYVEHIERVLAN